MSDTNTVSPLRQRMIEDMAARKLNPHTQRGHSAHRSPVSDFRASMVKNEYITLHNC
jgi:hypothetical protein